MVERIIVGPLHTNAYIVSAGKKHCILIDPGGDASQILRRLEALNVKPLAIVLTHGHLDHTAVAGHICREYEGTPIGIHRADSSLMQGSSREQHLETFRNLTPKADEAVRLLYDELPEPDFFLADGEAVCDSDLAVIHTPGHTAGSVCFYSEEREVLFSGDTLLFTAVGGSEGPGASARDLRNSIMQKLFKLPEQTRLFPGHGPLSSIEREKRSNVDLRDSSPASPA
ncbi:MAG: MBL fold metallo-hydrolase [Spirochaetaceae bacterium]|nr:MAG: MBL fold metallo-hydrolase [Spirochaetaceae bacterium]